METISSADIEALRTENALLRQRLSAIEAPNGHPISKNASIADLVRAGIVLESITDAFFGLDGEWRFAYLNREAQRLLGRDDLVGKNLWDEFAPALGSTFDTEYRRARREQTSVHFESFYPPLGTWFEVRAYPLTDGLAVYFQSINERKRTERDLQRRESELRVIIDSVPVIVSWVGPDGRFRQLNRKFKELFDRDPEWAIGRTLGEVAGEPHVSIARPYIARALAGEVVAFDSKLHDHRGTLREIRVFYIPQTTPEGDPDGFIAMVQDVTEQQRSEAALRESENRFRTLFELAGSGMALFSFPEGRILRANSRFAEFLGYRSDEVLGMSFSQFTHSDEVDESASRYRRLALESEPRSYQVERRYIRKDGTIVWGQSSVSLIPPGHGEESESLLVVDDVTSRKLGEEALRESEQRLRLMAESLPQLVWTCLPNGYCDYLSRQWVQYTGMEEAEQLQLKWLDLVIHPEDRERTQKAWTAAVRGEAEYDLEYRLRRHDGEYRWFKTRGRPMYDGAGQIVRWFGTCTDIHDQREAEEERLRFLQRERQGRALAEVLNGIGPMLLTELDSQRLLQKVTDLATELIGAQLGAFFQKTSDGDGGAYILYTFSGAPREAFASFPMPRTTELFDPTFSGTAAVLSADITKDSRYGKNPSDHGKPPGRAPVTSYLAVPVISRAGEVMGGLFFGHPDAGVFAERHAQLVQGIAAQAAIALDNARLFTEVQRSENALRTSNLELQQANADLEQFAYAAAHDLQEPLRMVTSYTQLLDRSLTEKLDDRTRTFMQYVVGGATRMSLLLQDLLAYTETSRAPEAGEHVSLSRALHQVLRNLQPAIAESGAQITASELPWVEGRESHFVQLLQNLISNAMKYRQPAVPLRVDVGCIRQGDRWLIYVRDNGMGIDPAYHKQVFGVFKRLHGSDIPGTGIGLAICQRVVERAGGEIWVESRPGEGSKFIFALPVLASDT